MKSRNLAVSLVAIVFAGLGVYFSTLHAEKKTAGEVLYASNLTQVITLPESKKNENGHETSLAAYRNRVLVVNFWATWCSPCVQEMPELSAMQTEMASKKINFIGIGIDSQAAMVEFAQKYKITYPLFVGGMSGTQLATALGNQSGGLPFTVILNKSGEIVKSYRGRLDMDELRKDILTVQ